MLEENLRESPRPHFFSNLGERQWKGETTLLSMWGHLCPVSVDPCGHPRSGYDTIPILPRRFEQAVTCPESQKVGGWDLNPALPGPVPGFCQPTSQAALEGPGPKGHGCLFNKYHEASTICWVGGRTRERSAIPSVKGVIMMPA